MGTWEYKTTSVPISTQIIAGREVTIFSLRQEKARYIPDWRPNPITKVWEQDPDDIMPESIV